MSGCFLLSHNARPMSTATNRINESLTHAWYTSGCKHEWLTPAHVLRSFPGAGSGVKIAGQAPEPVATPPAATAKEAEPAADDDDYDDDDDDDDDDEASTCTAVCPAARRSCAGFQRAQRVRGTLSTVARRAAGSGYRQGRVASCAAFRALRSQELLGLSVLDVGCSGARLFYIQLAGGLKQ